LLLAQVDPAPVTNTLLLEELVNRPMEPSLELTLPPLLITRLLLLPLLPTKRSLLFVQAELVPVTSTLLFDELVV
jgi:hypothetical protein